VSRDVKPMTLTFRGGLNTYSDETAVSDDQLVEALNVDMDLDGSARNRPPFTEFGSAFPYSGAGDARTLGWFYLNGTGYLLVSDGVSKTYAWDGAAWLLVTDTFSATGMIQFQDEAWLIAPWSPTTAKGGGKWTPTGGFTAQQNMPRGTTITSYKERLFVARGRGATDGSKIYYSNVFGLGDFWPTTLNEQRVGSGDGQDIIHLTTYYDNLLIFRSESIWTWGYSSSPGAGQISVIVPGIGLESSDAVVAFENAFYFMYDSKAYLFMNNRAEHINPHVPFRVIEGVPLSPSAVSMYNRRVVYSYKGSAYVFSLLTNSWTRWKSDVWGPFGKITQNNFDDVEVAYAIAARGDNNAVTRTNLAWNSALAVPADVVEWNPQNGGTRTTPTTGGPDNGPYARWTRASDISGVSRGFSSYGNPFDATPGATTPITARHFFIAGEQVALSVKVRSSVAQQHRVMIRFHDGAGSWVSTRQDGEYTAVGATGWTTVSGVFTVPADGYLVVRVGTATTENHPNGSTLDAGQLLIERAAAILGWFNGSSTATPERTYAWLGTVGNSASTELTLGTRKFLRTIDRVTSAVEQMTCILQTKNYSFQLPSNFKILHRWGLDIRFQDRIVAVAAPVTYNAGATWDQLLSYNWDQLGTWDNPLGGDQLVEETIVDSPAVGPDRKYVKLRKRMRFRQIFFRIEFDTDGGFTTAPAQLFSIVTFVDTRQGVVKQLS